MQAEGCARMRAHRKVAIAIIMIHVDKGAEEREHVDADAPPRERAERERGGDVDVAKCWQCEDEAVAEAECEDHQAEDRNPCR